MTSRTPPGGRAGLPPNFRRLEGTKLFRSARPELAKPDALKALGISTIVDLRIPSKDESADMRRLHLQYAPCVVLPGDDPLPERIFSIGGATDGDVVGLVADRLRHVFVPLLSTKVIVASQPWYYKIVLLVLHVVDWLCGTKLLMAFVMRFVVSAGGPRSLYYTYVAITERCRRTIRDGLVVLSEPGAAPALLTCSLGKDRTGILAALVLWVCGRPREVILADYSATQAFIDSHRDDPILGDMNKYGKANEALLHARSDTMRDLLESLDERYGSVGNYLEKIGFGARQQEALRQNVLA